MSVLTTPHPSTTVRSPDLVVVGDPVEPAALAAAVVARLEVLLSDEAAHRRSQDPRFGELIDLLSDYVLAGGKRLRPTFCLLGHLAAGGSGDDGRALDAAAALELLHAFALLHDDVMDGSDTRRGLPAMHRRLAAEHRAAAWRGEPRRYGEGVAVLLGDLAFAYADRLLSGASSQARIVWDELRVELTMGQYLDVRGAAAGGVDLVTARRIALLKSGRYTVTRPLQFGAAVAERATELAPHLAAFGDPVGEAFQLRDDLLGVFGDAAVTGKPVGDDLREGKPTVLLALARQTATPVQQAVLDRVGDPGLDDHDVDRICEVLVATGARDAVEGRIRSACEQATEALDAAPVPPTVRAALLALAEACTERAA